MQEKELFVVVGPTSSGKSDYAVDLALSHNGEIISADSRQLYKGLDIGTGKITKEETRGVPHYMLSIYDLGESISVTRYKEDTLPIIEDIFKRGKTPIICGGTGYYIDALIFKTSTLNVPENKELRSRLELLDSKELHKTLEQKDPLRASNINENNKVRIIRALEIIDSLGKVPQVEDLTPNYKTTIFAISRSRKELKERISLRLEKRLASGMIEEVKQLLTLGYKDEDTLKKFGIEYVSIAKYLQGKINEADMKKEILSNSYHYAKRQETWNKKYKNILGINHIEIKLS